MFAATHRYPRLTFSAFLLGIAILAVHPAQVRAAAAATTTTLAITDGGSAAVESAPWETPITLTATVHAGAVHVGIGQVNFCDATAAHCTDIHILGTGQLTTAGTAAFKFVPSPGVHSYKAEFRGTTADAASTSVASSFTVEDAPTITTIAQSGSVGSYTLKATVTGRSSTSPTGKVEFLDTSDKNKMLGSAELAKGAESITWTTPQSPELQPRPQSVIVADFNGDGIPDIAVAANGITTGSEGYINVMLGNGDGTFQAAKAFATLPNIQAIAATPFVDGGPVDILAIEKSASATDNAQLFIGNGKGGFTAGSPFGVGMENLSAIITGDFNGDGKQDYIVGGTAFGVPAFNVFLGNGNGTYNAGTLNATSDVPITGFGTGDFTGQGALDVAIIHSDGTVDVFLQDGVGDFYPNNGTKAGSSPTAIVIGDFNGDGHADLAIANGGGDDVSILLGNGAGDFTAAASPPTGGHPTSIAMGDFNGDGIIDLAVANSTSDTVTILLGKGNGTFTVAPALHTGNTPVSLAVGKFSGEQVFGLAVANNDPSSITTGTASILLPQLRETAIATATGIAAVGAGNHLVDASYAGDDIYQASVSATVSIAGSAGKATAPVFSPAAGKYTGTQKVTLSDATSGATIYYTVNGTTPTTASTKYTAAISVAATETIKAIAIGTAYTSSAVATAAYTIEKAAATPVFSPKAGTYSAAQSVKITDTTAGATIYYTTNGATPTTASTKYTVAISVTATKTIKAIAVATGYASSTAATAAYVIK